ncbi:MAG: S-layer protein domain-containing protein [Methanohalobium sp.]|uniref:S-layer protein domain-containing protein n=1 Tax=Methanohalobium sp. TaxID=2837493 RepID=UPI00397BA0DB
MKGYFKFIIIGLLFFGMTAFVVSADADNPPSSVTNLNETDKGYTWINWTWDNPNDAEFNHTEVYINGEFKKNVTKPDHYYNATDLDSDTEYTIDTKTVDDSGNKNNTNETDTATTNDNILPSSVTDLKVKNKGYTWINWTWDNPNDDDFNHTEVYINGTFKTNVSKPNHNYNATGLSSDTEYTIDTKTVDTSGNRNNESETNTASTKDNTPPNNISDLSSSESDHSINWTWNNPDDSDFDHTEIYINGNFTTNISREYYELTEIPSDTTYNISTRTVDDNGNINSTWENNTATTKSDNTAPSSVTNLHPSEINVDWIKWTWDNPDDFDFNHTEIWIDGEYQTILPKNTNSYKASGFNPETKHTIKIRTVDTNGNENDTADVTNTTETRPKTYFTGNRIWDESKDMSTTYKWTAESYSGFYYDLDTGLSSETMTISDIGSNIDEDDLEYSTEPIETDFEYSGFDSYQVIGFMAERYFAGYLEDDGENGTDFVDEDISVMSDGQLSKVLMDTDERESVFSGSALELEDGYRLNIVEIDLQGDSVLVRLTKDGDEVDTTIVSADDYYTYEKDLGSTDDVPIIAINFAEVFQGTETNAVFIEGIFQISDEYTEIAEGDSYGKMEIDSVRSDKILMENDDSISLSSGDIIDIMGNLKIIVADDSTLRFAPFVDRTEPGTYEVRGTVFEEDGMDVSEWTPLNFEGFYYDIDEGLITESLEVTDRSDRNIQDNGLEYISDAERVDFEHNEWGKYNVIGFMAEKYFAGYLETNDKDNTKFTDKDISPLSDGQLSKVLIDSDERNSIYSGSSLILEEGYTLHIIEVDVNGDNVFVELRKGGEQVEQGIVSSGEEFVYEKDLGSTDDVPIIAVNFNEIFRGQETNAVFVEGIFQISDEYTEIENGDSYGKMEIDEIDADGVKMKNDDNINLGKGDTINVMDNIKFKVADDDKLRYYPFVEVTTKRGESLDLDMPDTAIRGEPFTITVTSRGADVENASIKLDDEKIGETSTDGTFEYTPEDTGIYTITAEKRGYVSASGEIDIDIPEEAKDEMSVSIDPEDVFEGDAINVTVTSTIGNEPIEDADVFFDQNLIGNTSEDGMISYTVTEPGFHKIKVSKDKYKEAEENIEVLELMADFEFSNLQINPPTVSPGETVRISADATNTGEVSGDYNVELVVNGSVVDSKQISLDVGENTSIQFNHSEEQTGNYSVEIGNSTGSFNVEEGAGIVLYSIIGVIGAIAVGLGYMFTKGGWTVEMVRGRITELTKRSR